VCVYVCAARRPNGSCGFSQKIFLSLILRRSVQAGTVMDKAKERRDQPDRPD